MFGFFTVCRPCEEKNREIGFLHGRLEKKWEKIKNIESCRANTEGELRRCREEKNRLEDSIDRIRKNCKNKLDRMAGALIKSKTSPGCLSLTVDLGLAEREVRQLKKELDTYQKENKQFTQEYEELLEDYNHLLSGYPEGMTPTDVKNLKEANCAMADDLEQLKKEIRALRVRLSNCGHYARLALDSDHSHVRRLHLENIVAEEKRV
jgi:chromosome segregation ATPase